MAAYFKTIKSNQKTNKVITEQHISEKLEAGQTEDHATNYVHNKPKKVKQPILTELALEYCKTDLDLFAALCNATNKSPSGMLMTLHRNCAPILYTTVVLGLIERYTGLEQHLALVNPLENL